jgi:hypothetical protein
MMVVLSVLMVVLLEMILMVKMIRVSEDIHKFMLVCWCMLEKKQRRLNCTTAR